MPTKRKRYMVSFPDDTLSLLKRDCRNMKMKIGARILDIVEEKYWDGIPQSIVFVRSPKVAAESRPGQPHVFRGSSRPAPEPASAPRAISLSK